MLNSNKIILREPIDSDIAFFTSLRNDLTIQSQLMSLPRANSNKKVYEWLESQLKDEKVLFFVIAKKENNQPTGFIKFYNMNHINGIAELGIAISKEFHGLGYARDAIECTEKYAKKFFNIRKIILSVLNDNIAAINLYLKLGYTIVGVHKNHFYHNMEYKDVAIMEKFVE